MPTQIKRLFGSDVAVVGMADLGTVSIMNHLWLDWAEIALARLGEAGRARTDAREAARLGPSFAYAIKRERIAGMQAVTAVASTLDAFYGAVRQHVTVPPPLWATWQRNKTRRRARMIETIKLGFAVGGRATELWDGELRWLYELRDAAHHYEEESHPVKLHPVGAYVAAADVEYSLEAAERAVALMLDVLDTCFRHPKPGNRQLSAYLDGTKNGVANLATLRKADQDRL